MLLSRKFIRFGLSLLGCFFLGSLLLLIANKHEYIKVNIPESLTPSFFQPPSDSYIIDIAIKSCSKLNSNNPECGLPDSTWTKIDKDLLLGNSWTGQKYLSYKLLKSLDLQESVGNSEKKEKRIDKDQKVIVDIIVANPKKDAEVENNKDLIPIQILRDFHNNKVYDDDEHKSLIESSADNIGDMVTDKDKTASSFMKEIEEERKKLETEDAAQKENKKAKEDEEKTKEEAAFEQNEKDQASKHLDHDLKQDDIGNKEDHKDDFNKDNEANKLEEQVRVQDVAKRDTVKSRTDLKVKYTIPSKKEIADRGWVEKSNGIWVKYGSKGDSQAVTGIDILFGDDCVDPRPNWKLSKDSGPISGIKGPSGKLPYLSIRRGPKMDYSKFLKAKPLKMKKGGSFKILQVSDLHFSTGVGKCRDPVPAESGKDCKADPRTLNFLEKVLDIEKPDMVVLTGDQIFGDESPDAETAVFKALNPFVKRSIPFAVVMGNHDDEGSLSRREVFSLSTQLPYALGQVGEEEVAGVGNYLMNVQGESSKNSALSLYFLDTHKYSPNPKVKSGYDWIKESQLKWMERAYAANLKSVNAYTKIHLSMAFFHIPIPEYKNTHHPFIGSNREGVTAPNHNTNARKVFSSLGIKATSCGHDHANDYCLLDKQSDDDQMWLCYGGGAGEGGYGGYNGYIRRMRIWEFDTAAGKIKTWKRKEDDPENSFDRQTIVQDGRVVNFE